MILKSEFIFYWLKYVLCPRRISRLFLAVLETILTYFNCIRYSITLAFFNICVSNIKRRNMTLIRVIVSFFSVLLRKFLFKRLIDYHLENDSWSLIYTVKRSVRRFFLFIKIFNITFFWILDESSVKLIYSLRVWQNCE